MFISERDKVGIKKNPKAFVDYLQSTDDVYENIEEYNPTEKKKVDNVWWYGGTYGS